MIITITGSIGSGKSTIGKILAGRLGYEYISGGEIFRKIAELREVGINRINSEAEENIEIDRLIDDYLERLSEEDDLVVDSRLAWYFINKSSKIYLYTDLETAVDRISKSDRTTEGNIEDKEQLIKNIMERRKSEVERFRRIYGIDIENLSNYDLCLNTGKLEPLEVIEEVLEFLNKTEKV